MTILHRSYFIPIRDLVAELDLLPTYDMFPLNICDGCSMLTGDAYSSRHLVPSHFGLAFLYARLKTGSIMVWWCPSVRPSVRPSRSVRVSAPVSVRVSVRQSQFSALFSYMLWPIELKFCMSLSSYEHSIKFECRQFPSIFAGVMPLLELRILKIHSFHTFLLHALAYWAEILQMTLFYCTTYQLWVSSICVNFCRSYAPFGT